MLFKILSPIEVVERCLKLATKGYGFCTSDKWLGSSVAASQAATRGCRPENDLLSIKLPVSMHLDSLSPTASTYNYS